MSLAIGMGVLILVSSVIREDDLPEPAVPSPSCQAEAAQASNEDRAQ